MIPVAAFARMRADSHSPAFWRMRLRVRSFPPLALFLVPELPFGNQRKPRRPNRPPSSLIDLHFPSILPCLDPLPRGIPAVPEQRGPVMPRHSSTDSHVRSMSGVHARPVEWLWPGWVPLGKLTVIDGDPGVGKSTLLLDLAARLSRDGIMPDGARGPLGRPSSCPPRTARKTPSGRAAAAGAVLSASARSRPSGTKAAKCGRRRFRSTCPPSTRPSASTAPACSSSTRSWPT